MSTENHSSPPAQHRGRKLKQYVVEEKLAIIDFAKINGNRAAGREFSVAESSIREWRKNEQRLRCMLETAPERSRLDGGGRRLVSDQLEKLLVDYVRSLRDRHEMITFGKVRGEAVQIWRHIREERREVEMTNKFDKDKDFHASMGWVCRFMKKNHFQQEKREEGMTNKFDKDKDKDFHASMGWVCRFMKRNHFRFDQHNHHRSIESTNEESLNCIDDGSMNKEPITTRKRRRKAEMPVKLQTMLNGGGFVVRQAELVRVTRGAHDEDEPVEVC